MEPLIILSQTQDKGFFIGDINAVKFRRKYFDLVLEMMNLASNTGKPSNVKTALESISNFSDREIDLLIKSVQSYYLALQYDSNHCLKNDVNTFRVMYNDKEITVYVISDEYYYFDSSVDIYAYKAACEILESDSSNFIAVVKAIRIASRGELPLYAAFASVELTLERIKGETTTIKYNEEISPRRFCAEA